MAACSSKDDVAGHAVDPEKLAFKQGTSEPADLEVQNVEVVVPAPSPEEQDSQQATVVALTSYLEVQIMYAEYLDMAESPEPDFDALGALGDQIEVSLGETEQLIRGAALTVQEELGSDWRDNSLLDQD